MKAVIDLVVAILFLGVFSIITVTLIWKVLEIALILVIPGLIVFYLFVMYSWVTNFDYYRGLFLTGDQETIWITSFAALVTLAIVGYFSWQILRLSLKGINLREFKSPKKIVKQEKVTNQEQKQEETYSYMSNEGYLRDLELLGLERKASQAAIRQSYRQLSEKYHPDVNPDPHATIIFKQIQKAYQNLMQSP